jgi:hypothetical protein
LAGNLEGDVPEPNLSALRALRLVRCGMLVDVEGVEVVAQCHEDAAVLGVFLGYRRG